MSLSDQEKNDTGKGRDSSGSGDFKPIDLNSLDSFEEEKSLQTPETAPDFDRFKLLFDPTELEDEGPVSFEALYAFEKEIKEEPFEPFIEGTGEMDIPNVPDPDANQESLEDESPEISPEELGFERGYEQGLEQGMAAGQVKGEAMGFEQGLAKGEAEGLASGEAKGFAKGEAQGLEKGLKEGQKKAEAQVAEQADQVLGPLKETLQTADQMLSTVLKRYEAEIISLVYKISEKAVAAKLHLDEEIVKETVLDALKNLVAPEEIHLSVSTEDYEYVEMVKDAFFEEVRSLKHVAVTSDPMIPKGGCRIETAAATISTDPQAKLDSIYEALVKAGMTGPTIGPVGLT